MPSLGADMEDGTLVEWRVKPGDYVKRGDIIAEVETQKGLIEIEVFDEGKIDKLLLKVGQKVPVGTLMALIYSERQEAQVKKPPQAIPLVQGARVKASPLAKKIAEENKVDLSKITGTGEGGVITKEDVEKFLRKEPVEKIVSTADSFRAAVAAAMSKSNKDIPHYYIVTKIDVSKALTWLAEENKTRSVEKRLLPSALFVKAVAKSLKDVKELNAIWENGLHLKDDINIGFVVSLRSGGIVVPTIHNADTKSLNEIMECLSDIITRARAMKLRSSDLTDSTITLTNLGEDAAETVLGVIYPPQVALVGFGGITEQPIAEKGMLDVRPVVNATLAADHRATDGIIGSRFMVALKNHLQKPSEL